MPARNMQILMPPSPSQFDPAPGGGAVVSSTVVPDDGSVNVGPSAGPIGPIGMGPVDRVVRLVFIIIASS